MDNRLLPLVKMVLGYCLGQMWQQISWHEQAPQCYLGKRGNRFHGTNKHHSATWANVATDFMARTSTTVLLGQTWQQISWHEQAPQCYLGKRGNRFHGTNKHHSATLGKHGTNRHHNAALGKHGINRYHNAALGKHGINRHHNAALGKHGNRRLPWVNMAQTGT